MNSILWVLAYTTKDGGTLGGFLKDPEFMFSSQEEAQQKKQEAFDILYARNLVTNIGQITVVPLNELDVEIV